MSVLSSKCLHHKDCTGIHRRGYMQVDFHAGKLIPEHISKIATAFFE